MNNDVPQAAEGAEIQSENALQKYSTLLQYLVYENQTYWTRAGYLLVAHSALFGFFANNIPLVGDSWRWEKWFFSWLLTVSGLVLFLLGKGLLDVSIRWTERWEGAMVELEKAAMGTDLLRKGIADRDSIGSSKKLGRYVLWLFAVLWVIALGYCLYCAIHVLVTA